MKRAEKMKKEVSKHSTFNTESKQYTIDELIKMGKERNSIKLAEPLYEKNQNDKTNSIDR